MQIYYVPEDLELGEWGCLQKGLGCQRSDCGALGQGLTLSVPTGEFAFQLEAYDLDDDPLTYQIRGTDAFYFSVDSSSGRVTLRNSLDREVRAEDGIRCPCLSGSLGLWSWRTEPVGHSLAPKPSSWRESCPHRGWGSWMGLHLGPDQVLPCVPSAPAQAHHHCHSV